MEHVHLFEVAWRRASDVFKGLSRILGEELREGSDLLGVASASPCPRGPQLGGPDFRSCKLGLAAHLGFPQGLFWTKACIGDGALKRQGLGLPPECSGAAQTVEWLK